MKICGWGYKEVYILILPCDTGYWLYINNHKLDQYMKGNGELFCSPRTLSYRA